MTLLGQIFLLAGNSCPLWGVHSLKLVQCSTRQSNQRESWNRKLMAHMRITGYRHVCYIRLHPPLDCKPGIHWIATVSWFMWQADHWTVQFELIARRMAPWPHNEEAKYFCMIITAIIEKRKNLEFSTIPLWNIMALFAKAKKWKSRRIYSTDGWSLVFL